MAIAQPGILTTIAGNGTTSYSGDGGPATAAAFWYPSGVYPDNSGNVYIYDQLNYVIRKVDAAGIITTVIGGGPSGADVTPATAAALGSLDYGPSIIKVGGDLIFGDGNRIRRLNLATGMLSTISGMTGSAGSAATGDGGPATAAGIGMIAGICFDSAGNMYIASATTARIRKITPAGIISTFAGTGVAGYSGDGGPATAATLNYPGGLCFDTAGNLYVSEQVNHCIRKISPSGIITTIAGTGVHGFSGDNGPATAAQFYQPGHMCFDTYGNLYVADNLNSRIRKISPSGIITSITAGGTGLGSMSTGVPASSVLMWNTWCVSIDSNNNLYVTDKYDGRVCKINATNITATSDSMTVCMNNTCTGPHIYVMPDFYPGSSLKTWFGDGTSQVNTPGPFGMFDITHTYNYPGIYPIKHVLSYSGTRVDSVTYDYDYKFCRTLPIKLYNDVNGNCTFEPNSEYYLTHPVTLAIDSNGIMVDSVTVLSGLNYNATGGAGDIYTFRVLNTVPGIIPSCPATGIIVDTLGISGNDTKLMGFHCSSTPGFDLKENDLLLTGRHMQTGQLVVGNNYCTPQPGTLRVLHSPKYTYQSASPLPTSVVGNVLSWDLGLLSSADAGPRNIHYTLRVPGAWLMPGDTANSGLVVNPVSGDMEMVNNSRDRIDTVRNSFDPNAIEVSPAACFNEGTTPLLTYAIQFENDGNDTARNIFVLDTIPNTLDVQSLKMQSSSHYLFFTKVHNGSNWVLKFDFPNIMLPDSTHHDQCTGMFTYTIKTVAGMTAGASIRNRSGIYFDDNEVVMTNTSEKDVCIPVPPPTGISAVAATDILFYPTPVGTLLHINNVPVHTSFRILNIVGATVQTGELKAGNNEVPFALQAQGMYIVELTGSEGTKTVRKIVKE